IEDEVPRTERPMDDLLTFAVDAHGGIERWEHISRFRADMSITGELWDLKGRSGLLAGVELQGDTREQRVRIRPFPSAGCYAIWESDHQTIQTAEGMVSAERRDPAESFFNCDREYPWDELHVAYVASVANWNHFVTPFLFTRPEFV